jgi:hypothetical protein
MEITNASEGRYRKVPVIACTDSEDRERFRMFPPRHSRLFLRNADKTQ